MDKHCLGQSWTKHNVKYEDKLRLFRYSYVILYAKIKKMYWLHLNMTFILTWNSSEAVFLLITRTIMTTLFFTVDFMSVPDKGWNELCCQHVRFNELVAGNVTCTLDLWTSKISYHTATPQHLCRGYKQTPCTELLLLPTAKKLCYCFCSGGK